jgi:acyl carrier protein
MKKKEFINQISEYCEFEEQVINIDTPLKSIDGYDSLAIMTMIAFIDEHFNKKITNIQIQNLTDFNSLITLIGEENFEND